MKICLDPGHKANYNKGIRPDYYEGNMTLDLAKRLKAELEEYDGIEVILTRSTGNSDPSLAARGAMAKGCDVFISLHSDASGNPKTRGVTVIRSLQRPNSVAFGKELANTIHGVMGCGYSPYSGADAGVWTRKYPGTSNTDYYGVIRAAAKTDCPYIYLIEHSFHTNMTDCTFLDTATQRQKLAEAEAAEIAAKFGKVKPKAASADLFRVQCGAFSKQINANALKEDLEQAGFNAIIKTAISAGKTLYRVQCGAFSVKANAVTLQVQLQKKGFQAIVVED